MYLTIDDSQKISDIQQEFTKKFPYLRIEFFYTPHLSGKGSRKEDMINSAHIIGKLRNQHLNGSITVNPAMTVTDLEEAFSKKFGLSVQVFRKSGSVWLETIVTDGWTLDEQNKEGEMLERMNKEKATGYLD